MIECTEIFSIHTPLDKYLSAGQCLELVAEVVGRSFDIGRAANSFRFEALQCAPSTCTFFSYIFQMITITPHQYDERLRVKNEIVNYKNHTLLRPNLTVNGRSF